MTDEEELAKAMALHKGGKITTSVPKTKKVTPETLPYFYTPHVAKVCKKFQADPRLMHEFSHSGKTVAVISDGTRVLGLGDIGPYGAMPVMEGKAMLFIALSGGHINAFPICIGTKDPDEFIRTVINIAPSFGAINLEDLKQPKCFYILERLQEELKKLPVPVPVWHDDQQGTAGMVAAGLLNALKVVGKKLKTARIVVNGAGAAGLRIVDYLLLMGASGENIVVLDSKGAIFSSREDMHLPENKYKKIIAADRTNLAKLKGGLLEVIPKADVLISATSPAEITRVLTPELIKLMSTDAIIFVLENPTPKEAVQAAREGGAKIVASGSFQPNQVNNMLIFPGVMWGVLESGAGEITNEMVIAGVKALAASVGKHLSADCIVPTPSVKLGRRIAKAVAKAAAAAKKP